MTRTTTTGVLGGAWRAGVTASGAVEPWPENDGDGRGPGDAGRLDWYVAADDRWHVPADEPTIRQTRVEGTPVVETRLRIPSGDAVQRVYSVVDGGGLTVVEVENDSPLPIAVAFDRGDLLSVRSPTVMPIEGIELPAGSVMFPVGHHATLTVAIAHRGGGPGVLPQGLPTALQVARGWETMADRAGRFVLPDAAIAADVVSVRCELALAGPEHPDDDPVGFLLGVGQLVRMGEPGDPWLPDVAHAVEQAVKAARRGRAGWELAAALDAAEAVFVAVDDERATGDLAALRRRLAIRGDLPDEAPVGVRLVAWLEQRLANAQGELLPGGLPTSWLGGTVEAYALPVGGPARVSFALRWHGERPAVLWEVTGGAATLTSPVVAPAWRTTEPSGEALWPAPPNAALAHAPDEPMPPLAEQQAPPPAAPSPAPDDGLSFS